MSRYIDVDKVLELIEEAFHKTDVNGQEQIGVLTCHRIVREAPTADVVEVRHGHWYIREYEFFTCSECGHDYWNGCDYTVQAKERLANGEHPNYCPNCGAKMDGERREE